MQSAAFTLNKISKTFGSNIVLREIDLELKPANVTVLMGANGAGKSTLVKILCGVHQANSGVIRYGDAEYAPTSPSSALKFGVVTVHQNINHGVIPDLDVASNLLIDRLTDNRSGFFLKSSSMQRDAKQIADSMNLKINLNEQVANLSVADKQLISIARAMSQNPKLLILDEPTSSLSATEANRLFTVINDLKSKGVAILYISHRMSDIKSIADRIITLRDGKITGCFEDRPLDYGGAVTAMLGREMSFTHQIENERHNKVFEISGIKLKADCEPFDLALYNNEIVAITGLLGSGKTEFAAQIFGLAKSTASRITLHDQKYYPDTPKTAIEEGVFMCPKDRATNAVISDFDLTNNFALPFFERHSRYGFLKSKSLTKNAVNLIEKLGVVCQSQDDIVTTLSGGNQQKIMVGRWVSEKCKVLILDEPFQGVDIQARRDIGNYLRANSEDRATIVLVAELDEAIEIADRIIVLHEGNKVGDYTNEAKNIDQIVSLFSGTKTVKTQSLNG